MFRRILFFFLFSIFVLNCNLSAQFTPVAVTGFDQDVIAEAGPSSLATTTMELDALASSNKVMYSQSFAAFAGITAGLPDNGTIINGPDTYQLAPYTGNNALFVKRGQTFDLNLSTPASYAKLRLLCFSTEGASTVNVGVTFTDGSSTSYISNYSLPDWFFGSSNIVLQGFGRCPRTASPPFTPDGLPSNPIMYFLEIQLNCTDIPKSVQKITISNVSTSGNAPFPNAVFLGLSGMSYSQNILPTITPSDCGGTNGSISLNVTGSSSSYSYSWNTSPVQTTATASGLAPGSYTCTITDAAGCINSYTGTVPLNNNAVISASATPVAICPGNDVQLNVTVSAGALTSFTWNPGSLSGNSVTVSPITTTTYTVNGTNAIGCSASAQVLVTVNPVPAAPVVNSVTICEGTGATLQVQNPLAGFTYNWFDAQTGGVLLFSGTTYNTPVLSSSTTYYVEAINVSGCYSATNTAVTVNVTNLPASPVAINTIVCPGTNAILTISNPQTGLVYNWYAASTGGLPLGSGITYTAFNVLADTIYYVEAVTAGGCRSSGRAAASISLLQQLAQPVVTLTNTTFTSLTFSWNAISGATGYEVSTNGGISFQLPSSGSNGTTHTVSNLVGNTTITILVRAVGNQPCETSLRSVPVSGTTFSSKEIFVPNVFTPNGDGKNDVLYVYGNYVATIQFRIFNQWGQLIFVSDNISNGWDGAYKGQQQPVGVYAYVLKVVLQDGVVINKKGAINLIR